MNKLPSEALCSDLIADQAQDAPVVPLTTCISSKRCSPHSRKVELNFAIAIFGLSTIVSFTGLAWINAEGGLELRSRLQPKSESVLGKEDPVSVGSSIHQFAPDAPSAVLSGRWIVYLAKPSCSSCAITIDELCRASNELGQQSNLHVAVLFVGSPAGQSSERPECRSEVVMADLRPRCKLPTALLLLQDGIIQHRFVSRFSIDVVRSVWVK